MKKFVMIICVCLFFISCGNGGSSGTASAQSNTSFEQFGLVANRSDGIAGITITSYNGPGGTVVIPREINGIPVKVIGREAFRGKKIFSITIPDSVISIGNRAFADNLLRSVSIPNSVTIIQDLAFSNNLLDSVTIPNSITSIGELAFGDNLITSFTIGQNVRFTRDYAYTGSASAHIVEGFSSNIYNDTAGTYDRRDVNTRTWTKR